MRWLACEFVDLEVSAIVPGNEPEVGTPLALITTEPERPESGSTPQWRCLSTHTRMRRDIGHYVDRVGPGHHVVVGRSSMPKSKAIGVYARGGDHGPDELRAKPLQLVPVGMRPRRARPSCRRAGRAARQVPGMTDYPAVELLAGRTGKARRVAHRDHNRPLRVVPATRQLPKREWSCAATSAAGEILPLCRPGPVASPAAPAG